MPDVNIGIIILVFLIITHFFLFLKNKKYIKILEQKATLVNEHRIVPTDGEDFEEFGIYDPIVNYIKNSSIIDIIIIIIGIILIAITLFLF